MRIFISILQSFCTIFSTSSPSSFIYLINFSKEVIQSSHVAFVEFLIEILTMNSFISPPIPLKVEIHLKSHLIYLKPIFFCRSIRIFYQRVFFLFSMFSLIFPIAIILHPRLHFLNSFFVHI